MQNETTPQGDEQELVTLHDGTQVSADTPTVELDVCYYPDGSLALTQDAVETYEGSYILEKDRVELTHGDNREEYAHCDDGSLVSMLGNGYCLDSDGYSTTYDGDKYWPGEERDHDLVYAEDTEKYHPEDDCYHVIVGGTRRSPEWGYVYSSSSYETNNSNNRDYYDQILGDFDIERDEDGDYYFSEDIERGGSGDNAEYHSLARKSKLRADSKFSIGFEVEKEDSDAVDIGYRDLYDETGWVKEDDGSLNDYGFELVTPTYDLMTDDLDKAIERHSDLRTLLNADESSNCGGHINFGIVGKDGRAVLDVVAGWLPLIYAMFPRRAAVTPGTYNQWSKAYKFDYTKAAGSGKYQAVAVHGNRIEFRVFSAVKSVKHLLWRRDLMRLLATNLTTDPVQVMGWVLDAEHPLHGHLKKVYTDAKLLELVGRAVDYYHILEEQKLEVQLVIARKKAYVPAQLPLPLGESFELPLPASPVGAMVPSLEAA